MKTDYKALARLALRGFCMLAAGVGVMDPDVVIDPDLVTTVATLLYFGFEVWAWRDGGYAKK